MSSMHKPRRRRKESAELTPETGSFINPTQRQENISRATEPAFPLVSFLWPARGNTSQWVILPILLMIVGLFRWTTGFWGYSGFQSPPMHGDFEAQRHWMEVTTQLPITQWYFHDLQWWGLDYPPLTAYHSWLVGRMFVLTY
jgi:alpha-1,3-glucosyltransferase